MPKESLLINSSYFHDLANLLNEGLFFINADCDVLKTNRSFFHMLGYDEKDISGLNFMDLRYDVPGESELMQKRINLFKMHTLEQAEKKILENSGDAIIITDFNLRIVTVNDAARRVLGYESVAGLIGKIIMDLTPFEGTHECTTGEKITIDENWRKRQTAIADEMFVQGKARSETYLFQKDGKLVPLEVTMSLLKDSRGGRRGAISICRDITARKLSENKIRDAYKDLEQKVAERTRNLQEANTALRVLVKDRGAERQELEERILANVEELVLPHLQALKEGRLERNQKTRVEIAEANLHEVIAPFSEQLSSKFMKLTPTEIQVASFIKHGKTTKQIAETLNLAYETIETHRKNIRKKLGLRHKKANLRTYLLSIK